MTTNGPADNVADGIAGTSALVIDVDRRKSLPIIRALGREKVRVIGLSYRKRPMGGLSKFCHTTYRCPDYRSQPEAFLQRLEEICEQERPQVLYPLEDVSLDLCIQHPETWTRYTRALLPSPTAFRAARDKWLTMEAARQSGVAIPRTACPDSPQGADRVAESWDGPAVIKPRESSGSRGLRYVTDPAEISAAYREISAAFGPSIIQERIPPEGAGLGVSVLMDRDHQPVAAFGHRRLREYPVSGGPSTFCESYRDEELIRQSIALLKQIEFVGVAMIEYKLDVRTGLPVLMEINPRFWGSLGLAIHAGVNFPLLYHTLVLGGNVTYNSEYSVGVRYRWLLGDFLHFLTKLKQRRRCPGFFTFPKSGTYYDVVWDDIRPTFGMLAEGVRRTIRGGEG